jgi:hypothetical protein
MAPQPNTRRTTKPTATAAQIDVTGSAQIGQPKRTWLTKTGMAVTMELPRRLHASHKRQQVQEKSCRRLKNQRLLFSSLQVFRRLQALLQQNYDSCREAQPQDTVKHHAMMVHQPDTHSTTNNSYSGTDT